MKFPFRYAKPILTAGLYILLSHIIRTKKYAKKPDKYPIEIRYKYARKIMNFASKRLDCHIFVEGEENIPHEASCFMANHLSDYDPFPFLTVNDFPTSFVGKKEIKSFPFIGVFLQSIDGLFLDRQDIKSSLKTMRAVETDFNNKLHHWVIFPEGTRNKDSLLKVQDFKHGSFRPAFHAQAPIVPVALYGTQRVFPAFPHYKKYPIFIKFLRPLYYEDYKNMSTEDIAIYTQNEIQKAITYDLMLKDHHYMMKFNKKKYKRL